MMQSRTTQVVLYGLCVLFCVGYAIDGVADLVFSDRSVAYVATLGQTGFTIMTVTRVVVCVVTGLAFGRLIVKMFRDG